MAARTKRKLTEAQLEAQKQRAEKFRRICKMVGDLSEDARLNLMAGSPILSVGGRELSLYNSCLLQFQRDSVTMVGGFQQWRSQGRKVKKGESGLMIWIPTSKKESTPADVPAGEVTTDATTGDVRRAGFIRGYVWDISQTEEVQDGEAETDTVLDTGD